MTRGTGAGDGPSPGRDASPVPRSTRLIDTSPMIEDGNDGPETIGRPQTSTRDRDTLRTHLQAWLTSRLPDSASPRITSFEIPSSNGLSSETVLLDVESDHDGTPRTDRLVARLAPPASAVPVFPVYDLDRQAQVMRLVATHTSVPVPVVRWSEPDPGPLGSPFFVMDRIDGLVPPDLLPYNFGTWLSQADAADQRRLQDATIAVLAALHGIDDATTHFSFLRLAPGSALAAHVDDQRAYYRWVADGLRIPLLEQCFAWLEDHWPASEEPTGFSWGDSRIGNIMYRDFEPVAVLDWEMAGLGPPELDLGWLIFMHQFFEGVAAQFSLPGMPDFLRSDDVATTYESLTGHSPRDLEFYVVYAALRHGIIMSRIQRRAIHFGEATMPEDPNDLITHRAIIEEMLATAS
jgi:aminoglycoside phosphotransferase (APT) family kinase protein